MKNFCMCNASSYSKRCKSVNYRNNLIICSFVYLMTKNGNCHKYTSPDQIFKMLNLTHDLKKYKPIRTSKLSALDKSKNNSLHMKAYFLGHYVTCLYPGELPCENNYNECFNVTSICIYQLNFNNHLIPCQNGRNLEHCKTFMCDSMLKCATVYCIPWSYVCNGRWDCPQGDDESICNENEICKIMFHCRNTRQMCLHLANTCDGHNDCPLGDDEMLCEMKLIDCPSYCLCLLYAIHCRALLW